MRIYAIGDIHGRLSLLTAAHDRIAADRRLTGDRDAPVIHLGDLVDRGPSSRGVIDFLMTGIDRGEPWSVLMGNHDRLFLSFLDDPHWRDPGLRPDHAWLHPKIGGAETLASYGVANAADRPLGPVHAEAVAAVPRAHRAFLGRAARMIHRDGLAFVHAGIRPGLPLEAQTEQDLLWIRAPFLDDRRDHGPLIVHGHTVVDRPTHLGNRLAIDTGAAYGGPLTAVVIEGADVFILTEDGRQPLMPSTP